MFKLVAALQKATVPVFRAATAFDGHPAGTFIIPSTAASQPIVEKAASSSGWWSPARIGCRRSMASG